jgi:hypothetical protein
MSSSLVFLVLLPRFLGSKTTIARLVIWQVAFLVLLSGTTPALLISSNGARQNGRIVTDFRPYPNHGLTPNCPFDQPSDYYPR